MSRVPIISGLLFFVALLGCNVFSAESIDMDTLKMRGNRYVGKAVKCVGSLGRYNKIVHLRPKDLPGAQQQFVEVTLGYGKTISVFVDTENDELFDALSNTVQGLLVEVEGVVVPLHYQVSPDEFSGEYGILASAIRKWEEPARTPQ